MPATPRSLPEPWPEASGSGLGARLSPEAAARPAAMARIILRRVGITPLLSLIACAVMATSAPDAAKAQSAAVSSTATARVTIRSNAARLVMGQVSLVTQSGVPATPSRISSPVSSSHPTERACTADDSRALGPACRMIVSDLP